MAKYTSGRQKNLKVGVSSYSENLTSLEVIGNVGIATTNATSKLYVVGDGYFAGVVTASNFYVGNSLIGGGSSFTQLYVSGVSTFAGITTHTTSLFGTQASFVGVITANTFDGTLSGYATSSGIATYATNAGIATYATSSGIATYATTAGIATYATTAGIATYATSAGIATYATNAGIATYATNAGIATYASNAGIATYATNAGIATYATNAGVATALQNSRTFEITGDIVASPISFNGTGNVSLAATIQPNSVALGGDTTGDYVQTISGTANQITVTSGTGEGSTPTLSIPNQFTAPQDVTVTRDLQVNRNLNVTGNITIGGTSTTIFSQSLNIFDPDIVLGYRTDAFGNDVSNDNTANHGGVALASTEGNPLVQLFIAGIETNPATYKKIMWFKEGTFAGLGTDAWLINYAVGIGSTQFPTGTRLAAGNVQFTQNDLAVVRNINASGVGTIPTLSGTTATYGTGNFTTGNIVTGIITNISGTNLNYTGVGTITILNSTNATLTNINSTGISTLGITSATNLTTQNINNSGITTTNSLNIGATQVISSARQLQNIASLDATTTATIESAIANAPNTFADLNVTGISTLGVTSVTNLTAQQLNVSGLSTFSNTLRVIPTSTGIAGIFSGTTSEDMVRITQLGTGNAFVVEDSTNPDATPFVVRGDGSVGIGTTNPTSTLTVQGNGLIVGVLTATSFSGNASSATYATNAGIATYATSSGIATYATTSGIATYATSSGIATYSTNAGIATYATSAGIATYATTAGIATYSTNSGVSTSVIGGIASVTQLSVSGVSTFNNNVYIPSSSVGIGTTNPLQRLQVGTANTLGINTTGTVFVVTSNADVGIGTTNPTSKLHVIGDGRFTGVVTATSFSGTLSGYATSAGIATYATSSGIATYATSAGIATYATTSGIATYATSSGIATYATSAGIATHIKGGLAGNILYQSAPDTTVFLTNGASGTILQSNGVGNAPSWINAAPSNALTGLTIRDEGTIVGSANSVTQLNFVGAIVSAASTAGIATITFLDYVSNAGIATYATNAGVSTNIKGGIVGNIPYQSAPDTTVFLTNGSSGTILQSNGVGNAPTWVTPAPAGAITGLTIRDEGTVVGGANSVSQLNFVGAIVSAASTAGIATITFLDYVSNAGTSTSVSGGIASVTSLTVSGISTFNGNVYVPSSSVGIGTTNPLQRFQIGTANTLGISTNGTVFVVTSNADVGIGTTNPTSKLHVIGDGRFTGVVTATTFSGNASSATYATSSGIATYATNAGIATYATSAGIATYATNAGIATYASNAGIATYATSAGIATYSTNSGVSTSVIGGIGSITQLQVTGISTFTNGPVFIGSATSTGTASQRLQVTGGAYVSDNVGIGTTNPTSTLTVQGNGLIVGVLTATSFSGNASSATYATNAGIATYATTAGVATALQNSRTFEITGDIVASPISFNGTGNVSLAATIQPNSVALGSDTTGDYVANITGTSNQITVTSGTGEGSTPTLSIPSQFTAPQDVTVTRDLQVNRNLNVTGNITIGGTTATIFSQSLNIFDPDIVLGYRTDAFGNDVSNDNTANHGGVALASTEGSPLVQLFIAGIETNPATYKKIMWFKVGTFSGLGTDAWLSNYAVGIGSTQFPTGTRLAAGNVQFTQNDLAVVRNINASGVVTATSFSGNASSATYATSSGIATYATNAGIATYATNAGVSTYATLTGIATYATNAGVSTSVIGGIASVTQLQVTGISTFTNGPVFIGSGTSTGTSSQRLQVTGGAYVSDNVGIGTTNPAAKLDVRGAINVGGAVSITAIRDSGNNDVIYFNPLNESKVSIGINTTLNWASISNLPDVAFVADNSIFGTPKIGIANPTSTDPHYQLYAAYATGIVPYGYVRQDLNNASYAIALNGSSAFSVGDRASLDATKTSNFNASNEAFVVILNGSTSLFHNKSKKFETSGVGVTVTGITQTDNLNVGTGGTVITTTSSGLVGIGTTNPLQKIHVQGTAYVSGNLGIGTISPSFKADIAGDARVTSTNKMRFGGTAGTTNFYIQYNSTANSLDFVAG